MTRVVHKGLYASDILATNFTRHVDDHLFTQAALGWEVPVGGETPIPTGMRPRHAVGKDATGRTHSVIVAATTADLWTRTVETWNINTDDNTSVAVTLTGLVGEAVTF